MTAPETRPGAITAAFWLLVVGATLLLFGGLITATHSFDALRAAAPLTVSDDTLRGVRRLYRGAGILFCLAAAALAVFAARARARDPRSRRAAMALGLTVVVVVSVTAVLTGGFSILVLLSLLPIVVGTLMLSRPGAVEWYAGD